MLVLFGVLALNLHPVPQKIRVCKQADNEEIGHVQRSNQLRTKRRTLKNEPPGNRALQSNSSLNDRPNVLMMGLQEPIDGLVSQPGIVFLDGGF